jgi:hypothetical protein
MKRMLAVVCGTVAVCGGILLLSSAHRLPAQTVEKKPSPTDVRSAPAKNKSSDSSGSSSGTRFDGTWRAAVSWKVRVGNTFNQTQTIIIKNGVANLTSEMTSTLASGNNWNDIPAPYNSSSPLYTKRTDKSSKLEIEGSNLKVHWQGSKLADWTPKTIPNGALKGAFKDGPPSTVLFILNEDHLIVTNGLRSTTYTRVGE